MAFDLLREESITSGNLRLALRRYESYFSGVRTTNCPKPFRGAGVERNCHVIRDLHCRLLNLNWRASLWSRDTAYARALDRSGCNYTLGPCDSEGRPSHAGKRSVEIRGGAAPGTPNRSSGYHGRRTRRTPCSAWAKTRLGTC